MNKLFYLIFISITLLSFTISDNTNNSSIVIVKSSESLDISDFRLTEGNFVLKSDKNYRFYLEIKSKKVKGKKLLKDYTKERVSGTQYNVIYTYEYLSSGKKVHYKDKYIAWKNGETINLKPSQNINIGKITLKTKIQENNSLQN